MSDGRIHNKLGRLRGIGTGLAAACLLAVAAASLSGCGSRSEGRRPAKATMVIAGSFGDAGFFDGAKAGFDRASKEFGLVPAYIACEDQFPRFAEALLEAASSSDVVVALGYQFADLIPNLARSRPQVYFIYVDGEAQGVPNLVCVDFFEEQGSHLAGILAALVSASRLPKSLPGARVGFLGGMDIALIREFQLGFERGARAAAPGAEVLVAYVGAFDEPAKAERLAEDLFDDGVDVIYTAAGRSGLGAIEAAKRRGRYVIGVDVDQRPLAPETILASMVKDAGQAIYRLLGEYAAGNTSSGIRRYGLADKGVGLDWGGEPYLVPAELRERIELEAQRLIALELPVMRP
jgi:basic membrane protein A